MTAASRGVMPSEPSIAQTAASMASTAMLAARGGVPGTAPTTIVLASWRSSAGASWAGRWGGIGDDSLTAGLRPLKVPGPVLLHRPGPPYGDPRNPGYRSGPRSPRLRIVAGRA